MSRAANAAANANNAGDSVVNANDNNANGAERNLAPVVNLREFSNNAMNNGADITGAFNANNSTLRHEEWKRYDDRLQMVARERLGGIDDLRMAGLVVPLGGLGTTLSLYERVNDMTAAEMDMEAANPAQNDRVTFDEVGVPIPIIHKDWQLNIRQIEASRTRGEPLPTTHMTIATRQVRNSIENMLFNGAANIRVGNAPIYGYTTFPQRNTTTLSGTGWATATGRDVIGDTKAMLDSMYEDNRFGPFTMYVAKDLWAALQLDYSTEKSSKTFLNRIEDFRDISMVKPGDFLADGNIVLVQLQEDVVDLAVGQDIVNIQWMTNPMITQYKVFGACAPRIKADRNGSCGIVHASPA